jgi:hypothetical protein
VNKSRKAWTHVMMLIAVSVALASAVGSSDDKGANKKISGKVKAESPRKYKGPVVVKKILEVEYAELEINPPTLEVTAVGEVPTGGFTKATLSRVVYFVPPEDGIQDYFLTAIPPSGQATQAISTVKAKDSWKKYREEAPWIRGLRVHGIDDGVVEVRFGP